MAHVSVITLKLLKKISKLTGIEFKSTNINFESFDSSTFEAIGKISLSENIKGRKFAVDEIVWYWIFLEVCL